MDNLSSRLSIDTPENLALDAEIAGFGTRCIAAMIDYTIIIALLLIITYLFSRALPPGARFEGALVALLVLIQFGLVLFYHLAFELFCNGQTPGKRWIGIRVVSANGLPLTATGAVIRNLVRLFDFLPIFYGVGLVVLFATRNTQRLGDLAARTVVIRERRQLTLSTLKEDLAVHYLHIKPIEPIPHQVRIDNLTQDDRRKVIDFLQRRDQLRDRDYIAHLVARQIARKIDDPALEREIGFNGRRAETFLEFVARAFELAEMADHRSP